MRVDVITTLGEFEDVAQAAGGTGEESAENTVTESSAEQPLEVSPEILTETTQDIPDGPADKSGLVTIFVLLIVLVVAGTLIFVIRLKKK